MRCKASMSGCDAENGNAMTLHYFNPWHDEALAARDAHCQPPLAARRLAADLACLPLWWAQPGDLVGLTVFGGGYSCGAVLLQF